MDYSILEKYVEAEHFPVMVVEMLSLLNPQSGKIYIDATFGRGGWSRAILDACPDCKVIAFDRDPEAVASGKELEKINPNFTIIQSCFSDIKGNLEKLKIQRVDGLIADFGVSSPQIDNQDRGFSFMREGFLDMRMSKEGMTAADVVNNYNEDDLAKIFWKYGEERLSRNIAKKIAARRNIKLFSKTTELANLVAEVYPAKLRYSQKIHPATRVFQALRIEVNQELTEVEKLLEITKDILHIDSNLIVVSFHSLEDKLVKYFLKDYNVKSEITSRYLPENTINKDGVFETIRVKALRPSETEIKLNPRSRSAKLRWAKKVK